MSDLTSAPWFMGDVVADRSTGRVLGQYCGPHIQFKEIREIATDATIFHVQTGVAENLKTVDPDHVRHATYADIGGGPLP